MNRRKQPLTIYYGQRRFVLASPSFVLDRRQTPYRRLAATVLIALHKPFRLEIEGYPDLETQAALIAPKLLRRRIRAVDSHLMILDIPMEAPEFRQLEPSLRDRPLQSLDCRKLKTLAPVLERTIEGGLKPQEFKQLPSILVQLVAGRKSKPEVPMDPRIHEAMKLIGRMPLDAVSLGRLAAQLGLSPSRLRHLFRGVTDSTVRHYARWVAVWRAVNLWEQGRTWTEIAHRCGFCDLAHLDHAFMEVFGLSPSTIFNPREVRLIRCS